MEFDRHHPLRDGGGGGASICPSSTSGVRHPSIPPDAGLNYYDTGALRSSSEHDQVQQFLYNADSAIPGHGIGPAGPPRDPLAAPSYCKDRELEIRRCCLREIANRIELAHFRMLEEHDRRAFAIAEQAPYSRQIPFYPEILPDNSQINHTAEQILHSRSPQSVAPMYDHLPVERHIVQRDLTLEPQWGPHVTVDVPSIEPVVTDCPVAPVPVQVPIIKKKVRTSADINRKRKKEYGCEVIKIQPTMQSKWSCAQCTVKFASEEAMDIHFQEKHHVCEGDGLSKSENVENNRSEEGRTGVNAEYNDDQDKKVGSAADTNKKRKKEHDHQVIDVKPRMEWSKCPCGWCSANFDSKEAMDAHLQEQHQSSIGNVPSESEQVDNNRTETRTSLTVVNQGDQKKISEVSEPCTNKRFQIDLPPANTKQIPDELHKGEVVPSSEDKEIAGLNTNNKIPLELPPSSLKNRNNKAYQGSNPQNKEIAGSSTKKKIKLDLPPSTVQNPENKIISKKGKLHLSPSILKQKCDEPSKEEVLPIPENKKKPATDTTESGCIVSEGRWFCDPCKLNKLTRKTLDDHLQSNAHLDKLSTLPRSKKSEPANNTVSENPVQEVSQAVSLPMLKELKEETSKSMPMSQLDKKMTSQTKGNQSLSNGTVISTGHKEISNPKANLSNKKKGVPLNGITQPILVSKDGRWFCNLCDAKLFTEKVKEAHIKGKRHRLNLQAAGLHWCFLCHIRCTSEATLFEHYNGKKHRQALMNLNVA